MLKQNLPGFNGLIPIERALGVQWCVESDTFNIRFTLLDKPLTGQGVMSTVMSIYDPLGLIAPVVLIGKQIKLCWCLLLFLTMQGCQPCKKVCSILGAEKGVFWMKNSIFTNCAIHMCSNKLREKTAFFLDPAVFWRYFH